MGIDRTTSWEVTCDGEGCQNVLDMYTEDGDEATLFKTLVDAAEAALSCYWRRDDGKLLCDECVEDAAIEAEQAQDAKEKEQRLRAKLHTYSEAEQARTAEREAANERRLRYKTWVGKSFDQICKDATDRAEKQRLKAARDKEAIREILYPSKAPGDGVWGSAGIVCERVYKHLDELAALTK